MVKIKRNANGDIRVAKRIPTIRDFGYSNDEHILDVKNLIREVSYDLVKRGTEHDWTKDQEPYRSMFYRDLCNTIEGKMNFEEGEWYKLHCEKERHHLLRRVPDDVDLIDVIEMVCDCVAAGLARSGEVRPLEIDKSILEKALDNTVKKVESMCELED